MRFHLHLLSVLLLAPLAVGFGSRAGDKPLAPDGQPGFGAEQELRDLLKLFRRPSDEQLAFVAQLRSIERDIGVLIEATESTYRNRGYFDLLDPLEEHDLATLHELYSNFELDPSMAGNRPQRIGRAFARMFLDTRFRVRRTLIEGWTEETKAVRHGLGVLEAAASSFVELDDLQASNITRRIDLAASVLRGIRSDLEILREPNDSGSDADEDSQEVRELLEVLDFGDRRQREQTLATLRERGEVSDARMRAVLFSKRLLERAKDEFDWRENADSEAREFLTRAIEASPDYGEDDQLPKQITRLSKSKRRKLARQIALEGLGSDPLDDELAWMSGYMSSFVYGELETSSHFDRFLVLRDIQFRDESSYAGRKLSEREESALEYVQEIDRRNGGLGGD